MSDPTTPAGWGIQLSKLWLLSGQDFPVKVKDIALEITKQKFSEPIGCVIPHGISGIDGMLSKRKKKNDWCISYDETVSLPGRINFTIAHELGHYLLHRGLQDEFQCGAMQLIEYDSIESKRIESQANIFASYLLMPRDDFDRQISGIELSFDLLGHCAERYQTSLTATALKWLEFTEQAAMLVVADLDEFICWSYCSKAAKKIGAYISPGETIPEPVLNYMKNNMQEMRESRRVAPGIWHPTEEAVESIIMSDQFERIIFLIKFPHALIIDHSEEIETDSFSVFEDKGSGLNWKK